MFKLYVGNSHRYTPTCLCETEMGDKRHNWTRFAFKDPSGSYRVQVPLVQGEKHQDIAPALGSWFSLLDVEVYGLCRHIFQVATWYHRWPDLFYITIAYLIWARPPVLMKRPEETSLVEWVLRWLARPGGCWPNAGHWSVATFCIFSPESLFGFTGCRLKQFVDKKC